MAKRKRVPKSQTPDRDVALSKIKEFIAGTCLGLPTPEYIALLEELEGHCGYEIEAARDMMNDADEG